MVSGAFFCAGFVDIAKMRARGLGLAQADVLTILSAAKTAATRTAGPHATDRAVAPNCPQKTGLQRRANARSAAVAFGRRTCFFTNIHSFVH
jgi:hypothetical protein